MPYNPGTGIYTLPAIYLAIPGTTILATQHNTPLEDLEVANNYARPIIAGGTGSVSAVTARGSTTGIATEGNIGAKGSNIASAATLTLVDNFNYNHVTGVVAVTAISTRTAGQRVLLEFEGILTLTHSAALVLPGALNIITAAGDIAEFVSEGAGNWRCSQYIRASVVYLTMRPAPQIKSAPGAFVYTPTSGVRYADFEAVGGGGGGGGVDGQGAGTGGSGGGGASGFYGRTGPINVTGAATFNGSIGAAGAAGSAGGGDGGVGGDTSITVGATTYTFGGGTGGGGMIANGTVGGSQDGGAAGVGTNVVGGSQPGGIGVYNGNSATNSTGGNGSASPLGSGGKGQHLIAGGNLNGLAAAGFGGGGGGGTTNNSVNNATGGVGTAGYMRIWEYY